MPSLNLILSVPSGWYSGVSACGFQKAHMIYKIKSDGHLYRSEASLSLRGGIMGICEIEPRNIGNTQIISEIENECTRRGFSGILLCCDAPIASEFTGALLEFSRRRGIRLYLPEAVGHFPENAIALISTAVSGGSLSEKLSNAKNKYGKIALDIERVRTDFTLPAKSGGTPLSAQKLQALIKQHDTKAFFSKELCAYYFTYRSGSDTHFVIYDNAASISAKIALGKKLGIEDAFLYYPEIQDILPHIEI